MENLENSILNSSTTITRSTRLKQQKILQNLINSNNNQNEPSDEEFFYYDEDDNESMTSHAEQHQSPLLESTKHAKYVGAQRSSSRNHLKKNDVLLNDSSSYLSSNSNIINNKIENIESSSTKVENDSSVDILSPRSILRFSSSRSSSESESSTPNVSRNRVEGEEETDNDDQDEIEEEADHEIFNEGDDEQDDEEFNHSDFENESLIEQDLEAKRRELQRKAKRLLKKNKKLRENYKLTPDLSCIISNSADDLTRNKDQLLEQNQELDQEARMSVRKSQRKRHKNKKFSDSEYATMFSIEHSNDSSNEPSQLKRSLSPSSSVCMEAEKHGELKLRIKRITTPTTSNFLSISSPSPSKITGSSAINPNDSQTNTSLNTRPKRKRNISTENSANADQRTYKFQFNPNIYDTEESATNSTNITQLNNESLSENELSLITGLTLKIPKKSLTSPQSNSPQSSATNTLAGGLSPNTPMTRATAAKLKQQQQQQQPQTLIDVKLLPPPAPLPLLMPPKNLFDDNDDDELISPPALNTTTHSTTTKLTSPYKTASHSPSKSSCLSTSLLQKQQTSHQQQNDKIKSKLAETDIFSNRTNTNSDNSYNSNIEKIVHELKSFGSKENSNQSRSQSIGNRIDENSIQSDYASNANTSTFSSNPSSPTNSNTKTSSTTTTTGTLTIEQIMEEKQNALIAKLNKYRNKIIRTEEFFVPNELQNSTLNLITLLKEHQKTQPKDEPNGLMATSSSLASASSTTSSIDMSVLNIKDLEKKDPVDQQKLPSISNLIPLSSSKVSNQPNGSAMTTKQAGMSNSLSTQEPTNTIYAPNQSHNGKMLNTPQTNAVYSLGMMNDSSAMNTSTMLSPNQHSQPHLHHPSLYQTKPQQYQMNYAQPNHQMASTAVLSSSPQHQPQQMHQKQMQMNNQMMPTGVVQNKGPMQTPLYHQQFYTQPQATVSSPHPQHPQQQSPTLMNSYTRSNSQQHLVSPSSQINSSTTVQHHSPILMKQPQQQPQNQQQQQIVPGVQLSPVISSKQAYPSQPSSSYQTSPASYTNQTNTSRSYTTQTSYNNQSNSNQYSLSPSTPSYSNYTQQPSTNQFYSQQAQPQVQMISSGQISNVPMNYMNQTMQMQNRQANIQQQQQSTQMFTQQPISISSQQQQQQMFNTANLASFNSNENMMTNKPLLAQQPTYHSQLASTQQPIQQINQNQVVTPSVSVPSTQTKTSTNTASTPTKNNKKSKEREKEKDSAKTSLSNTPISQSTNSTSLPSVTSSTTAPTSLTNITSANTVSTQQTSATNGAASSVSNNSNARGQRSAQHQLTVAQLLSQKHQQQQQTQNQPQVQSNKISELTAEQIASNRTLTSPLNVPLQQASSTLQLDSGSANNKSKPDELASILASESASNQDENSLSSSSSSLTLNVTSKADLVNNKQAQIQPNQQQKPAIITKPNAMQASIQKIQTIIPSSATSSTLTQTTTSSSVASAAAALFVRNVSTTPTNMQTIAYQNNDISTNQESELIVKPAATESIEDKKELVTTRSVATISEQQQQPTAHSCQESNRAMIECQKCGAFSHQECLSSAIDQSEVSKLCSNCINFQIEAKRKEIESLEQSNSTASENPF